MKKTTLATLLLGVMATIPKLYASEPLLMSYYSNWDTYSNYPFLGNAKGAVNNDLGYKLARINTVAYAFFEVNENGSVYFSDPWSDLAMNEKDKSFCAANPNSCLNANFDPSRPTVGLGNFDAFSSSNVPHKIISIGGAGHDISWENAMNNPEIFANSVSELINYYNLNGVDIDYEPVGGMPSVNYSKFINLLVQLRQKLGPTNLITYTIPANAASIQSFGQENWGLLTKQVNYINIMGYDLHGAFDNPAFTGLHSSLYSIPNDPTQLSDDAALTALTNLNVDSHKIILGFPSYGRAVSGVQESGLNQTFSQSFKGDLDTSDCSIALGSSNMCSGMVQYTTLIGWPSPVIPYTVNDKISGVYTNNNNVFASYDNVDSLAVKANYARNKNLGGMMMWELRYDAPAVDAQGKPNPQSLLNTVDGILGITIRPFTPQGSTTGVKLELTNNDPVNQNVVTLISPNGQYYAFPILRAKNSDSNNVMWCSSDISASDCAASWNLDTLGNTTGVKVQVSNQQGNAALCSGTLDLTQGYHHIQVNYSNPNDMCALD